MFAPGMCEALTIVILHPAIRNIIKKICKKTFGIAWRLMHRSNTMQL